MGSHRCFLAQDRTNRYDCHGSMWFPRSIWPILLVMTAKPIRIQLDNACVPVTTALLDEPTGGAVREHIILLAHGAGLGMTSPFMEGISRALVARGFVVMRFNYAYQEVITKTGRKRPPERKEVLVETHLAARNALAERFPSRPILFAGKSMGSRMGSYLVEVGVPSAGLIMFGYPLHPAGKPHKLRKDQFPALRVPALFLTGTRDSLADLKLLKRALQKYAGDATLDIVQGANHDFQTLAVQRKTPEEVRDNLADRVVQWLASRPEE